MSVVRDSMQAYYAARAPEYDRIYDKPERQADLRAIEQWLPALFAGTRLLEVACGTGYWTRLIAPVTAQTVGIDAAAETIRIAAARTAQHRQLQFVIGDAYRLPFARGRFDAAFAGFWFSHVPKQRRHEFLAGLAAVLAPGAKVVLLDNRYVDGSSRPISERDADGNSYQTRPLDDGSSHRVLKNFPSESELRDAVAGFGHSAVFSGFEYYWALQYVAA